jgi:hypothetical protein
MGTTQHGWVLALATLLACDADPTEPEADGRDDAIVPGGKADGIETASPAEIDAILALANMASHFTLDVEVRLDVRAANGIVAHRSGPDGIDGTDDDNPFENLAELDAVPWVGPRAFGKMLDWVRVHASPEEETPCVLISEYIEGTQDRNKGIELYNCGESPVDLSQIRLCMVRNDDTDCTIGSQLARVDLEPGDVYTTCRTDVVTHPTLMNPHPHLADRCDQALGSTMIFSGDDRMVVLHDPDGTNSVETANVLDALGRIAFRPWWSPWNDVGLRRCTAARNPGTVFFDERDWFVHAPSWSDMSDWGVPPTFSCDD